MSTPVALAPPPADRGTATAAVGSYRPVIGDGTSASSRARRRWRSWRWPLLVIAVLVLVALAAALARPPMSVTPIAPDNATASGAQAVAQVLSDHGVEIEYVRHTADAVSGAEAGSTLLVIDNGWLDSDQLDLLREVKADLVLVEPSFDTLDVLTDNALTFGGGWSDTTTRPARCEDPDAVAAERISTPGTDLQARTDAFEICFTDADSTSGAYAVGTVADRTVRVFSDPASLLNSTITEQGNAALALRALGHHDRLVWYIPDPNEYLSGPSQESTPGALLPPWTTVVLLQLGLVALVAMVWRGRRLGPLVTEDLPVVVRASETTRGRGRLYRKASARGHAAAGLRAATADRLATSLGLARSTPATVLIEAVARATARPDTDIAGLLYGPPPTDDAALLALARHLDQIESEVHHP